MPWFITSLESEQGQVVQPLEMSWRESGLWFGCRLKRVVMQLTQLLSLLSFELPGQILPYCVGPAVVAIVSHFIFSSFLLSWPIISTSPLAARLLKLSHKLESQAPRSSCHCSGSSILRKQLWFAAAHHLLHSLTFPQINTCSHIHTRTHTNTHTQTHRYIPWPQIFQMKSTMAFVYDACACAHVSHANTASSL